MLEIHVPLHTATDILQLMLFGGQKPRHQGADIDTLGFRHLYIHDLSVPLNIDHQQLISRILWNQRVARV